MSDIGRQLVDSLYAELMIDDEWAVRRDRGFTWWGYRLAQHVEASPTVHLGDQQRCVVRVWTEVAREVSPASNPAAALAAVNRQQSMSAAVWDRPARRVNECATTVVSTDTLDWHTQLLATAAVLQNVSAHANAPALAQACGGTPALSNHPDAGERAEMDGVLGVPAQRVIPAGAGGSRYTGPLVEGLGGYAAKLGFRATADATGLVCEVPYPAQSGRDTALLRISTTQAHPVLGHGALVVLRLPVAPGGMRVARLANELNAAEAHGESAVPLLGAWCPDVLATDGNGLAFTCFLPNLLARTGLLEDQIGYQAARARFAQAQLSG